MGTSSCDCDSPLTTEAATAFVFFNISARSAEDVASAAGANSRFRTTPAQSNFHSSSASEAGSSDPSQYNSTPRTAQLNSTPAQLSASEASAVSTSKATATTTPTSRSINCLLLCQALYDLLLPFSPTNVDGIVCGACRDVHTLIFRCALEPLFMRVRSLWHARKASLLGMRDKWVGKVRSKERCSRASLSIQYQVWYSTPLLEVFQ
jgi:hypothetical protein